MIFLAQTVGDLATSISLGITGNYTILTFGILFFVFLISYLFGREIFAFLATSMTAIGLYVFRTPMNTTLLAIIATIFGILVVYFFYRLTNK